MPQSQKRTGQGSASYNPKEVELKCHTPLIEEQGEKPRQAHREALESEPLEVIKFQRQF